MTGLIIHPIFFCTNTFDNIITETNKDIRPLLSASADTYTLVQL